MMRMMVRGGGDVRVERRCFGGERDLLVFRFAWLRWGEKRLLGMKAVGRRDRLL